MRGIFAIDPGESTGVAWGIVDDRAPYALEAVKHRLEAGSTTLTNTTPVQIRELFKLWTATKRHWVSRCLLDPDWIDLVVEDFVLFPGEKPGRSTTAPERVAWGFEGYRMHALDSYRKSLPRHYTQIIWQKSGAASRFKKRSILEQADAWIVGRDHERSAFAHMILRTNILLDHAPARRAPR